jgi:carboxyl-terminal processing protease
MKRKISAILAADVAGYTKLVADDEEETIRRLTKYRETFADLVSHSDGRIFNTAGDAILAEFGSAVDAVRCAIDVQESLRTRNAAYPASRQMAFRIGISIGDVIERDGDLLGDGVNVASRLEGLAPPGGICISRSVYEQVANKISVDFADIGLQQVKNIPNPVHVYRIEGSAEKRTSRRPFALDMNLASILMLGVAIFMVCLTMGVVYLTLPGREAAKTWEKIKDTTNIATYEAFIARYKDSFYTDLARVRIQELKKQEAATQKAEAKQQADAVALKIKTDEEALAKQAEARRREEVRLASERKAAERTTREANLGAAERARPTGNQPVPDSKLVYQAAQLFADVFNCIRANYPEKVDEAALLSRASGPLLEKFPGIFENTDLDAKIRGLDPSRLNGTSELLAEIFASVLKQYGRTADPEVLLESMLNGVLKGLDAQTYYLRPERYRSFQAASKGEFGGVGLEIRAENGLFKVVARIDDSPAAKLDLRPGDQITAIDGSSLDGLTLEQVVGALRGPLKSPVTVTIQRKGTDQLFYFNLVRDLIHANPVKARLEGDVIYIKLSTFNEQSRPSLQQSIHTIKKAAGDHVKGYILDLRNNSGGLLDSAISVADEFLDKGTIATIKRRGQNDLDRRTAQPGDIADGRAMIVLVNGRTGSGAEIVAAALQDHKRAQVIGTRTLGKGSIQTVYPFGEQGALRLTTQYIFSPSGKALENAGVSPDVVIEQDAAGAGHDAPFDDALARLRRAQ